MSAERRLQKGLGLLGGVTDVVCDDSVTLSLGLNVLNQTVTGYVDVAGVTQQVRYLTITGSIYS